MGGKFRLSYNCNSGFLKEKDFYGLHFKKHISIDLFSHLFYSTSIIYDTIKIFLRFIRCQNGEHIA